MKRAKSKKIDEVEMQPEYDFSIMKGAVRGKYFKRYFAGVDRVRFTLMPVPTELVSEVEKLIAKRSKSDKRSKKTIGPLGNSK